MSKSPESKKPRASRRDFIKTSSIIVASGAAASTLSVARGAHAYGSDTIKIGLIGCGGRGTGATIQAMNTKGDVNIVAMADAFDNRLQSSLRSIQSRHGAKVDVPQDRRFVGFDAYKQVLASDIDLVILATPPGFRPLHFEAAVNAGKHVFMEKPVAVDGPGVRRVLEAAQVAKKKSLAVQVGLQRRHEVGYKEIIARLQDGAIGDINLMRAYWNGGGVWVRPREDNQTELEYQMRNWYYFTWLCGDHIDEQHIHNLDVINWLKNGFPVQANGMGGREVRNGIDHGEIFDHHFVEYTYADGSKLFSQCRHIKGCWNSVSEHASGSNGHTNISGGLIYNKAGEMIFKANKKGDQNQGHQQEHHDFFALLRKGELPMEAEYGAKSSMTAVLGRMATYSGKTIKWEDAINSETKLADVDNFHSYDDEAPVQPNAEGRYAIAVPGRTKPF
ncbi:MAG: Gfo/Idh/MocA family oxidoreductase [Pirellulaceae bacterium]|jgi:predicted dehydrogenase|nr:Gfo/Idh/MocA family oxidoreductase [Planctomycetaceae bacterium]HIM28843.1 Gfo/Idh/MocA family oxidoreductase [Planctomycetota bacterium]